jgi:hypothetical protein
VLIDDRNGRKVRATHWRGTSSSGIARSAVGGPSWVDTSYSRPFQLSVWLGWFYDSPHFEQPVARADMVWFPQWPGRPYAGPWHTPLLLAKLGSIVQLLTARWLPSAVWHSDEAEGRLIFVTEYIGIVDATYTMDEEFIVLELLKFGWVHFFR